MVLLFIIEIIIGKYINDAFIRPYVGDFLVVILIYTFVKSFWNFPVTKTTVGVLLFSFVIETLQYFKLVEILGLGKYKLARIVIGTSFSWGDLITYSLGIGLVLVVEIKRMKNEF